MVYSFIELSCTRHAALEKISSITEIKLKTLKSFSDTRQACRSEAVNAIKDNYDILYKAIKEISDSSKHADVRVKGIGILSQMKTFEFVFAMEMLHPISSLIFSKYVSTKLKFKFVICCTNC